MEVFVCNVRTFQSLFYSEKDVSEFPVQLDYAHFLPDGTLSIDGDSAFISIVVDDDKIHDVYVDIETYSEDASAAEKGVCDLTLFIQDDLLYGGRESTRVLTERKILHNVEASHYVFFESFGNTKLLQLELKPQNGNAVRIHNIKLNARRPLLFSFVRFIAFLGVLEFFFLFRPNSFLWKRKALYPGKKGLVVLLVFYFGFMAVVFGLMSCNALMWDESFNPYALLASSLADGKVSVGDAIPEIVAYEDKLVSWGGDDERIMFDYALYHGKYYVYFGVLPALIMYLPYHMVTGADFSDAAAEMLIIAFLMPGLYFLLREIISRFFKATPLALHLLLTIAMVFGSGIPMLLSAPQVYNVAILSGVALTIWGIYLLLHAFPLTEHPCMVFFGSLCMALVAACRPTLMIYSLIIIPLLIFSYNACKGKDDGEIKAAGRGVFLMIAVPYIAVAAGVMYYNYIRFDSPFQFGMIYNMTGVPSRHTAVDLLEMLPIALYEYFFRFPQIEHVFPFICSGLGGNGITEYSGTIYYYGTLGCGLFAMNPIFPVSFIMEFSFFNNVKDKRKTYLRYVLIAIIVLTFICFDTYITQAILVRYTLEYSFLLFVIAGITFMRVWNDGAYVKIREKLVYVLVIAVAVSVVIQSLAFFSSGVYPFSWGNTELYYRIFYLCHFI
ncbi:MAG: hypothetical protein IKO53_02910 [Lachnospiraceae bacterium]|nr:hypothetical protein [Lachnospiraceae bacterium]